MHLVYEICFFLFNLILESALRTILQKIYYYISNIEGFEFEVDFF